VPARSATVLITSPTYDPSGWVFATTDARGLVNRVLYDRLGRTVQTVEAYTDGIVSNSDDKTITYTYDGSGQVLTLSVALSYGSVQTTGYVYGVSPATGSAWDMWLSGRPTPQCRELAVEQAWKYSSSIQPITWNVLGGGVK
jgi:hypothetical protein